MDSIQLLGWTSEACRVDWTTIFLFMDQFALDIKWFVGIRSIYLNGTVSAIEHYTYVGSFRGLSTTASAFPSNHFFGTKFYIYHLGIWRFPVIVVRIATAIRAHARRVIHLQAPTCQVNHMCSIIQCFTCPPMPKPMPVIMH